MHPKVFLSHSKKDRDFIVRIANDLRSSFVDVWYDEWEIPPGESFQKRIFEEGIPDSDLFFVYLTPNTAGSYWVEKELESGILRDADNRGGTLAFFVDSDETRNKLRIDLRTPNSPVLNADVYELPLRKLVARAWEAAGKRKVAVVRKEEENAELKLKNRILELEKEVLRLLSAGASDVDGVMQYLEGKTLVFEDRIVTLAEILDVISDELATGTNGYPLWQTIIRHYDYLLVDSKYRTFRNEPDPAVLLGPLMKQGIVAIQPWGDSQLFFLTGLGREVAKRIEGIHRSQQPPSV